MSGDWRGLEYPTLIRKGKGKASEFVNSQMPFFPENRERKGDEWWVHQHQLEVHISRQRQLETYKKASKTRVPNSWFNGGYWVGPSLYYDRGCQATEPS